MSTKPERKTQLCVLCGGRSTEHEVSLQSARNVVAAIDTERFEVTVVGIAKSGAWNLYDPAGFLVHADDPARIGLAEAGPGVALVRDNNEARLVVLGTQQRALPLDVAFPVLHGTFGEDGTVQGLLELVGVPYVGSDVAASSLCMDKTLTKRLLREAGIAVARAQVIRSWERDSFDPEQAAADLRLPLFVKPARLGSSVGISKVHTLAELRPAVNTAFRYDTSVLVEEYVPGRELECSVLGNERPRASLPGEVIPNDEFYSYRAKYLDANGARLLAPAELDSATVRRVQDVAVRSFQALSCAGMARVDFFLDPAGKLVVNEINTIPGFTNISMYPRLWQISGLPYRQLIAELIDLAGARFRAENARQTDFSGEPE